MKITKKYLQKLIKEEVARLLNENPDQDRIAQVEAEIEYLNRMLPLARTTDAAGEKASKELTASYGAGMAFDMRNRLRNDITLLKTGFREWQGREL
jgi:hypothetical protein